VCYQVEEETVGGLEMLNIPLMSNNINEDDKNALIEFLQTSDRFTNGPKVREFEKAWSDWLGVKYSVFVNSGSSANFITMGTVRELYGDGEVILPPIGWTSDVSSVIAAGLTPVFVDVNKETLSINAEQALERINGKTRAVLMTHVLGHDGMDLRLREECTKRGIVLIEDVCESHGATHEGRKLGSFGDISNFSFYYAHHMSTIEGGVLCTNDEKLYRMFRMYRSHGMLRECDSQEYIDKVSRENPDIWPEFIFTVPGYNMRSTELNAVLGLNQLKRLDANVAVRKENYDIFLDNLDGTKYFTDFKREGNSNYAFVIMTRNPDKDFYNKVCDTLKSENVEFRRGTAGGGNVLRQPFLKKRYPDIKAADYPNAEYIHEYGIYVGNYPDLEKEKIFALCEVLNKI
jgi:CDP-6-deoxy-D-xylo-4-hexulose-3-dehydrase